MDEDYEPADDADRIVDPLWLLAKAFGSDFDVKIDMAYETGWACAVRITPEPNTPGPDRSIVSYSVGGGAISVLASAVSDAINSFYPYARAFAAKLAVNPSPGTV